MASVQNMFFKNKNYHFQKYFYFPTSEAFGL